MAPKRSAPSTTPAAPSASAPSTASSVAPPESKTKAKKAKTASTDPALSALPSLPPDAPAIAEPVAAPAPASTKGKKKAAPEPEPSAPSSDPPKPKAKKAKVSPSDAPDAVETDGPPPKKAKVSKAQAKDVPAKDTPAKEEAAPTDAPTEAGTEAATKKSPKTPKTPKATAPKATAEKTEKTEKAEKAEKKTKDKEAAKKEKKKPDGFSLFRKETWPSVKGKEGSPPTARSKEATSLLRGMWEALTADQKSAYASKAARKERKAMVKGACSSYIYFSRHFNVDKSVGFAERAKLVSEAWKALSDEGKRPFEEMAAKDKERSAEERKMVKKRTPYNAFCSAMLKEVVVEGAEGMTKQQVFAERTRLVASKWKALSQDEKKEWEATEVAAA